MCLDDRVLAGARRWDPDRRRLRRRLQGDPHRVDGRASIGAGHVGLADSQPVTSGVAMGQPVTLIKTTSPRPGHRPFRAQSQPDGHGPRPLRPPDDDILADDPAAELAEPPVRSRWRRRAVHIYGVDGDRDACLAPTMGDLESVISVACTPTTCQVSRSPPTRNSSPWSRASPRPRESARPARPARC